MAQADRELRPGQAVDRYVVESALGTGGTASVYLVRHRTLGTLHALKRTLTATPAVERRLESEGRAQAKLIHPGIVRVTDVLTADGQLGLLMEYVDGPSLQKLLEGGALPMAEVDRIFRGIVQAVGFAHASGFVHRDLKPANVLMARAGDGQLQPRITDFGLAKAWMEEDAGNNTKTGWLMGTPGFMSPEQIEDARRVDPQTDLFALGAILYEMACGRPAFTGATYAKILMAIQLGRYLPPERVRPDLTPEIGRAIRACLEVERERRVRSAADLLAILDGAELSYLANAAGGSGGQEGGGEGGVAPTMYAPNGTQVPESWGSGDGEGDASGAPILAPGANATVPVADGADRTPRDLAPPELVALPAPRRSWVAWALIGLGGGGVAVTLAVALVVALADPFGWQAAMEVPGPVIPEVIPPGVPDRSVPPDGSVAGIDAGERPGGGAPAPTPTIAPTPPTPTIAPTSPTPTIAPTLAAPKTPTSTPAAPKTATAAPTAAPTATAAPAAAASGEGTLLVTSRPNRARFSVSGGPGGAAWTPIKLAPGSYTVTVFCEADTCKSKKSDPIRVQVRDGDTAKICWDFEVGKPCS